MQKQTLIFRLWCTYVHLSARVWEPFEKGSHVRGALLSLLTHSEDSLSSPKVTFGGCVFRMRVCRLRKPGYQENIEIIRRLSWYFLFLFFFLF